jgi:hypothetical protein
MHEITINLHMHTRYSDGSGTHADIARAALESGLHAVIITDHNVVVKGVEGYVGSPSRRVLVLTGEEIHDRTRIPQKNHLLVLGADRELAGYGQDAEGLLTAAGNAGGLCFVAHLHDPAAPAFHEPDISWEDWTVRGFMGIELWNGFSELKMHVPTRLHGIFYAYFPAFLAHCPPKEARQRWDELLRGRRIVAVGGSDAHALQMRLGLLRRVVFPYKYHFGAINTHLLLPGPFSGDAAGDARLVYTALAAGHGFIAYDRAAPGRGFRFAAYGEAAQASMGDEMVCGSGVTIQAYAPDRADLRLLKDGQPIQEEKNVQALTHRVHTPGVYRLEAYRRYLGRRRGWIFSNPIYVR